MQIEYRNAYPAWEEFKELVISLVLKHGVRSIVEIGAGANPLLPVSFVEEHRLLYQLVDYSAEELKKAGPGYQVQVMDLQQPIGHVPTQFDLVIAQMTLEHIEFPETFFANIRQLLRPGGRACLFYAAVTNLPMMLNHLLPDGISHRLLMMVQPFRKNEKHGKFPAFYRWCYGPTRKNIARLQSTGLDIELYRGYFGHSYYRRLPLLPWLEKQKTRLLLRFPNPAFCTYAQVVLYSPAVKNEERLDFPF